MLFDLRNLLHSMAISVQRRCAQQDPRVDISYRSIDPGPRNLWREKAVEDPPKAAAGDRLCADTYGILRVYGGTSSYKHPKPTASVQLKVTGPSDDDAWLLAVAAYEAACLDENGSPLRMFQIESFDINTDAPDGVWMLVNVDTTSRPGQIGRDQRGRVIITANFDVGFYRAN